MYRTDRVSPEIDPQASHMSLNLDFIALDSLSLHISNHQSNNHSHHQHRRSQHRITPKHCPTNQPLKHLPTTRTLCYLSESDGWGGNDEEGGGDDEDGVVEYGVRAVGFLIPGHQGEENERGDDHS